MAQFHHSLIKRSQLIAVSILAAASSNSIHADEFVMTGYINMDSRQFKGHRFTKIKAYNNWNLAVRDDGVPVFWGLMQAGKLPGLLPEGLSADGDIIDIGPLIVYVNSEGRLASIGENEGVKAKDFPKIGTKVVRLVGRTSHYTALDETGKVYCWGFTGNGACDIPPGLGPVKDVACGSDFTVALLRDGTVRCWGRVDHFAPKFERLKRVVQISACDRTVAALLEDGTIVAGGNPQVVQSFTMNETTATQIFCGSEYLGAVLKDGSVRVWGSPGCPVKHIPSEMGKVKMVSGADAHALALLEDGQLVAWGNNFVGEGMVPGVLSGVTQISADDRYIFASVPNRPLVCWGYGRMSHNFELEGTKDATAFRFSPGYVFGKTASGTGVFKALNFPPNPGYIQRLSSLKNIVSINESFALTEDGQCHVLQQKNPAWEIPENATELIQLETFWYAVIALRKDGTLIGWGSDRKSCLNFPKNLPPVESFSIGGYGQVAALLQDQKVKIWGANDEFFYQNSILNRFAPIKMIDTVGSSTAVLTNDGKVVFLSGLKELREISSDIGKIKSIALCGGVAESLCMIVD